MTTASRALFAVILPTTAASFGILISQQPRLAVVLLVLVVGVAALGAPTAAWVGATLVAALTFKGLTTLGALPATAIYLDIPLAWGAFAVSLLRQRRLPSTARLPVGLLAGLAATIAFSALLNHSELVRPVVYLALLGEPLAVTCALLIDAPTRHQQLILERTLIGLLAIQIPLTYWQAANLGFADPVQGTLYGAGAGAHVVAGVVVLGIMWLLGRQPMRRSYNLVLVALLAPIPFIADAKQVVFALPFALLATRWKSLKDVTARVVAIVASVGVLLVYIPAGQTALHFLRGAQSGHGGKTTTFDLVWAQSNNDPASLLLGQGPAETVSRAAFLTTDSFLRADSPLRSIGLAPARLSSTAQTQSEELSGGGTSFNSGLSSMIGVFGDIGVMGFAVYASFWIVIAARLRRLGSSTGSAALSGVVVFGVLGYVFDWWEQPPFTIVLAIMTGLALNETSADDTQRNPRSRKSVGGI